MISNRFGTNIKMCKSRANETDLPIIFIQDTPSKTCKNSKCSPKLKNTRAAKIPLCAGSFRGLKNVAIFWFCVNFPLASMSIVHLPLSLSPLFELYNIY